MVRSPRAAHAARPDTLSHLQYSVWDQLDDVRPLPYRSPTAH